MRSFAVVVHPTSPDAREAAERFAKLAGSSGAAVLDASSGAPADAVVAFGGDGTILTGAGVAASRRVPLLGVNVGRLGFLSSCGAAELEEAIERLTSGDYTIESRMMLEAEASAPEPLVALALNEFVLEKPVPSRVIRVRVAVGEEEVATYTADGFIVATPTGSTAYSLSAGGPIVEPALRAMILTPVSSHSPVWRAIVVGPERAVSLSPEDRPATLSADGRPVGTLPPGTPVVVRPSDRMLESVRLGGPAFFTRLRARFNLDAR